MRQIIIFAGLIVAMGVVAARMADQAGRNQAAPPASPSPASGGVPSPSPSPASGGGVGWGDSALAAVPPPAARNAPVGTVTVPRDPRGHFVVAARVDGRRMSFMLDTGASLVALRRSDAALLGMHPFARDFNVEVKTANGTTHAAKVDLGLVEIDGLMVRNVAALISPDETLSENLLGLSFLSRLRGFSYREGRMVLEQ